MVGARANKAAFSSDLSSARGNSIYTKPVCWIKIILAALIHNTKVSVDGSIIIWQNPIDLMELQRSFKIIITNYPSS